MSRWSTWKPFPDPSKGGVLTAPFGAGIYELRNRRTGKLVLVGEGSHCAYRMSSLLPHPLGEGRRNNSDKRRYVLRHLAHIEYRCFPCASKAEAVRLEKALRSANAYRFPT